MLFSFAVLALSVLSAVHALVQVGRHIPLTRVRTLQRLGPAHFLENDLSDGLVTNVRNFAYLVHVSIGRQEFSMSFDTGSSDLVRSLHSRMNFKIPIALHVIFSG